MHALQLEAQENYVYACGVVVHQRAHHIIFQLWQRTSMLANTRVPNRLYRRLTWLDQEGMRLTDTLAAVHACIRAIATLPVYS